MPDENIQVTEEAPSTVTPPSDPEANAEWRLSGKLPEAKPDAKGEAKEPEKSDSGKSARISSAPESETGKTEDDKKTKSKAQARLDEILADIRNAGFTPAELKTFRREAQKAEVKQEAIPEKTVQPPTRPLRPKLSDYPLSKYYDQVDPEAARIAEYDSACEKYETQMDDWRAFEFNQRSAQQRMDAVMVQRLQQAQQRYGPESVSAIHGATKAIVLDSQIDVSVKQLISSSPVMVDLLYVLGQKPEEFTKLMQVAKMNPAVAIRNIAYVERMIMEELSKGAGKKPTDGEKEQTPERNANGQFVSSKNISKAPPPPEEVHGKKGTMPDEVESAVANGDFANYRASANRRDMARMRGN
jgi:hypothetical protein